MIQEACSLALHLFLSCPRLQAASENTQPPSLYPPHIFPSLLRTMSPPRPLLHSFAFPSFITVLLLFAQCVRGQLRFIDDTYGDSATGVLPSYSSDGVDCWNEGPGCSACTLQPQASQAHNGTWHDTTSDVCNNAASNNGTAGHSVTFNFVGMCCFFT